MGYRPSIEIVIQNSTPHIFDSPTTDLHDDDTFGFEYSIDGGESWVGPYATEKQAREAAIVGASNVTIERVK